MESSVSLDLIYSELRSLLL